MSLKQIVELKADTDYPVSQHVETQLEHQSTDVSPHSVWSLSSDTLLVWDWCCECLSVGRQTRVEGFYCSAERVVYLHLRCPLDTAVLGRLCRDMRTAIDESVSERLLRAGQKRRMVYVWRQHGGLSRDIVNCKLTRLVVAGQGVLSVELLLLVEIDELDRVG